MKERFQAVYMTGGVDTGQILSADLSLVGPPLKSTFLCSLARRWSTLLLPWCPGPLVPAGGLLDSFRVPCFVSSRHLGLLPVTQTLRGDRGQACSRAEDFSRPCERTGPSVVGSGGRGQKGWHSGNNKKCECARVETGGNLCV